MASKLKFLYGKKALLPPENQRDPLYFYFCTDTKELYLGEEKLNIGQEFSTLTGSINALKSDLGSLQELKTTSKNDAVSAINETFDKIGKTKTELLNEIQSAQIANTVSISKSTNPNEAIGTVYTLSQNGEDIGTINVPKDLVLQGGQYIDNTTGTIDRYPDEPCIVLTLNDADGTEIIIPVGDLVDTYKVESNTSIEMTIDSNNTISAIIADGAVDTNQLAIRSVTEEKIVDNSVSLSKLKNDVTENFASKEYSNSNLEAAKQYADELMYWEDFE